MIGWLKSKKKAKEEAKVKKREFLSTLTYGVNLNEYWEKHRRLEIERRNMYERVTQTALYKEYERLKEEERDAELAVTDAIRRHHGLPLSEQRWNDGYLVIYDSILTSECDESPIGWCASYTPEGGSIGDAKRCLFCKKEI